MDANVAFFQVLPLMLRLCSFPEELAAPGRQVRLPTCRLCRSSYWTESWHAGRSVLPFSWVSFLHLAFRISTSPTLAEVSQAPLVEQQGQTRRRLESLSLLVCSHEPSHQVDPH